MLIAVKMNSCKCFPVPVIFFCFCFLSVWWWWSILHGAAVDRGSSARVNWHRPSLLTDCSLLPCSCMLVLTPTDTHSQKSKALLPPGEHFELYFLERVGFGTLKLSASFQKGIYMNWIVGEELEFLAVVLRRTLEHRWRFALGHSLSGKRGNILLSHIKRDM